MSKAKERNCRLCLEILEDNYIEIEKITDKIFQVLLLKVDFSVSEEPVICKNCMESIEEAFIFKSICISVNKQVISFAMDRNSTELDIRDVYLNENENKGLAFNEDYSVCRLCLQCLEKSNFNLLNDLRENLANEMVLKCIPELDLNVIKKSVICTACMKSLESYYSFAMKCWNVEKNIIKYCAGQGAECDGQINLSNILKFVIKDMPECIDNCSETVALKEDNDLFQKRRDTYSNINNTEIKIEQEEFVIKDENKSGVCAAEENNCGEIIRNEVVKCDKLTHRDSSNIAVYTCERCTYATKYKWSLKEHILIHKDNSEVTTYKCNLCSYEAKWKTSLRHHTLTHKDSSDVVMYRCEMCTFETKHKNSIKRHMLVHKDNSEVTMYKCNLCSYEAKWKRSLQDHMLIHKDSSDVVMYRCEGCAYETKYKNYLKLHKLVHRNSSEVTMYKCNSCSYESKWKKSLRRHMLTHKDSEFVM